MSQEPMQQVQSPPGARPAPTVGLDIWGATDKGRQREGNEDAVYPHSGFEVSSFVPSPEHLARQGQLLVVADGVGGAQAGAQASRWAIGVAVEKYYELFGPDRGVDLGAAVEFANTSLYQYLERTKTQEAGCTMAAAVIHDNLLYVANVGDSRVYLIRNGQAVRQTRDHTLTQQKLDSQMITPEEAKTDSGRNVLTRSLGAGETVQVDVFAPLQLAGGDVVLICSDGLTDMLPDAEIAQLVGGNSSRRAAQRLIDAANSRGGFDNISVVLARVGKPSDGGVLLDGLFTGIRRMPLRRKLALLAIVMFVAVACCVIAAAISWMYYDGVLRLGPTATPASTAIATEVMEEATLAATETLAPAPTAVPSATSTPINTSTPLPTSTPTNTPVPPTPTPTPTPVPTVPTEAPVPTSQPAEPTAVPTNPVPD